MHFPACTQLPRRRIVRCIGDWRVGRAINERHRDDSTPRHLWTSGIDCSAGRAAICSRHASLAVCVFPLSHVFIQILRKRKKTYKERTLLWLFQATEIYSRLIIRANPTYAYKGSLGSWCLGNLKSRYDNIFRRMHAGLFPHVYCICQALKYNHSGFACTLKLIAV